MAQFSRLRLKRIYDPPESEDGLRFLVDRLWPRGLKKDACQLDGWLKELAPSDALRRWFGHNPARWEEFQARYTSELEEKPDSCRDVARQAHDQSVTLLYAARDQEHNHALVLKAYLERLL